MSKFGSFLSNSPRVRREFAENPASSPRVRRDSFTPHLQVLDPLVHLRDAIKSSDGVAQSIPGNLYWLSAAKASSRNQQPITVARSYKAKELSYYTTTVARSY